MNKQGKRPLTDEERREYERWLVEMVVDEMEPPPTAKPETIRRIMERIEAIRQARAQAAPAEGEREP